MSGLCRSIRAPCRAQRSKSGSRNGISIATTQDDGDGEHAYDAQKVAYNRSWDGTTSTLNPPSSTDARRA